MLRADNDSPLMCRFERLAAQPREKLTLNDAVSRAIKTLSSRFLCFRLVRDSHVHGREILVHSFSHRTEKFFDKYFGNMNTRFRISREV